MKSTPNVSGTQKLPGKMSALGRELLRKMRQVGFFGTALHIGSKCFNRACRVVFGTEEKMDPFDATYGTDTNGIIGVGSLDIPADQMAHSMHYGPIEGGEFTSALKDLRIKCDELIFVDVGSGKGRMLLLASLFPFKRIIGVELSRMLHEAAVRNIRIFEDPAQCCLQIEAINENAATFDIPGEPALYFLANPFDDCVMKQFVSNLGNSLKQKPRKVYLLYIKPCYRKELDESGFLQIVRDTGRYVFYENQPGSL